MVFKEVVADEVDWRFDVNPFKLNQILWERFPVFSVSYVIVVIAVDAETCCLFYQRMLDVLKVSGVVRSRMVTSTGMGSLFHPLEKKSNFEINNNVPQNISITFCKLYLANLATTGPHNTIVHNNYWSLLQIHPLSRYFTIAQWSPE